MRELVIGSRQTMRQVMLAAWEIVGSAIDGGAVVVQIMRDSKSRQMERKYHAMINEISQQVTVYGKRYDRESWKALLIDGYEQELAQQGERLTHPGRLVASLDGQRMVTIRPSSKQFRKHEGSGFIEYLYSQGVEMGVVWSDPALEIYNEYAAQAA